MNISAKDSPGAQSVDTRFSSDRPIKTKSEDQLQRNHFASSIAKSIRRWKGDTGLVIAVYGQWGAGKSSLKNLILEDLNQNQNLCPSVIEFNPWMWSGQDRLLAAFFNEIGAAISGEESNSGLDHSQLARKWRKYGSRLALGSATLGSVQTASMVLPIPWLPLLFKSLDGAAKVSADLFEKAAIAHEAAHEDDPPLESLKKELTTGLLNISKPILVVLDDVDRLTQSEIRLLFQIVKTNVDFPNMIYLILCDRQVVENALDAEYVGSGRAYLEKIVQVGFDLPKLHQSDIDHVLASGLNSILLPYIGPSQAILNRWQDIYPSSFRPFFTTLRDVHRFLSVFAFTIGLFLHEKTLDVNPIDLVGIEILRIFEPDTYHRIASEKEFLTGGQMQFPQDNGTEKRKQHLSEILNTSSEQHRQHMEVFIHCLFPELELLSQGTSMGAGLPSRWARELRICHASYFDRYFELQLQSHEIRQAELEALINASCNRSQIREILEVASTTGRLAGILEALDEGNHSRVAVEDAQPFITAMFDISDDLPNGYKNGLVGLSYDVVIRRVVQEVVRRINTQEQRDRVVLSAIKDTTGVSGPVKITWDEAVSDDRKIKSDRCVLTDEALEKAKGICVRKIEDAAEARPLPHSTLHLTLAAWREFGGDIGPREYVKHQLETCEGAARFIQGISGYIHSTSGTAGTTKSYRVIRLKEIELYADVADVQEALKPVMGEKKDAPIDFDNEMYEEYLDAFHDALERRDKGQSDNGISDIYDDDMDDE